MANTENCPKVGIVMGSDSDMPVMAKAADILEELGIPLPNPEKPKGRNNNRKQTFDAVCRTILFDIARRHGLHLDQEPSYGGRNYLEKQDYILMKQKEQLAAQSRSWKN